MTMHILYIPASDMSGGQCRIYATSYPTANPKAFYQKHPELWREVGIMGHDGRIVCLDAEFKALMDDAPLMAGSSYPVNVEKEKQR